MRKKILLRYGKYPDESILVYKENSSFYWEYTEGLKNKKFIVYSCKLEKSWLQYLDSTEIKEFNRFHNRTLKRDQLWNKKRIQVEEISYLSDWDIWALLYLDIAKYKGLDKVCVEPIVLTPAGLKYRWAIYRKKYSKSNTPVYTI